MRKILLSDVKYIPTRYVTILKKENIETVEDLLFSYPNKFEDYTITNMKDVVPDTLVTIAGIVQSKAMVINAKTKLSIMNFYSDCDGVKIKVTIFNRHFLKSKIQYGTYVRLTGKLKPDMKSFVASEIHFDEFSNYINPVFNIKNIPDDKMLDLKRKVFEDYEDEIDDFIPKEIREKYNIISSKEALRYINIPEDMEEVSLAIKRIKFEELFIYQLKIKYMLYMRKHFPQGVSINYDKEKIDNFINSLPYKLTVDQMKSLEEIFYDMKAPYKMNRLLQGEVGSGKTVVAAISLFGALTAGYQGAIMVPTEVLVNQHYSTFVNLFKDFELNGKKINIDILSSSVSTKDRKQKLEDLKNGNIDIIIGTHSLFGKDVEFKNLGLVVTDEEHRFGVRQRVSIVGKGYLIDHLKMSATPIPRTLAISVLGESDISIIKTLPGKKKDPITKYITYNEKMIVFDHMKKELDAGHQIYVICPTIVESETMDLQNATRIYERMSKYYEGVCKVGLIHSKLKNNEKEEVMDKFNKNEIQILVSTSVIEVGVNVIKATTMVILDADRFGIAQLHQMRGRVRRSDEQPYCFLISDTQTKTAIDRLKLVESNNDGFVLSEEDLLIRGPGDFFGEKQTGVLTFKMADIVLDKDIFLEADKAANEIMSTNDIFENEEYKKLYEIVNTNYVNNKEMLD